MLRSAGIVVDRGRTRGRKDERGKGQAGGREGRDKGTDTQ